ncbi:MAG: hypothetical protein ABTQ25_04150 [Nitrosomonas ureae]
MIFDPVSSALYGNDGIFIKKVECPLALKPEQLERVGGLTQDRHCESCNKTVRCIDGWSDEEMRAAIEKDERMCIFATSKAKDVIFLRRIGFRADNVEKLPVVTTVRNLAAMAAAIDIGYQLVFINVGDGLSDGDNHYRVLQNKKTGRLWWSCDYRLQWPDGSESDSENEWKVILDWFYVRMDRPFPLAAYVVPNGLTPGSRVFIEDIIEDLTIEFRSQGDIDRVISESATWSGESFQVDRDDFITPCLG